MFERGTWRQKKIKHTKINFGVEKRHDANIA